MDPEKLPPIPPNAQQEIERALKALPDVTVGSLLEALLGAAALAERRTFLEARPEDKANGFYQRGLQLGAIPLSLQVPRTRSGDFRPSLMPEPYQRAFPEDRQRLLLGLLAGARSLEAARRTLGQLGLSASEGDLDAIANELLDEFELLNAAPLPTDMIALFCDAKAVDIRDGDRVRRETLYLAVAIGRDGHKRLVACRPRPGRESLDGWKELLKDLLARGLRRILIIVHDDFSGLLKLSQGLFHGADVQLCIVHMQRNAGHHFTREENARFQQRIRAIKNSYDHDRAAADFEELCNDFEKLAPTFIKELRRKATHYLAFLRYPDPIRKTLSTTNAVEAVNGELERLRINGGGYFQSQKIAKVKIAITTKNLHQRRWKRPAANTKAALQELNRMFEQRFENDEP